MREDSSVRFVPVLGPSDAEVEAICGQVARRVLRLVSCEAAALCEDDAPDEDALSPTLPLALPPGPAMLPRAEWEHPDKPRSKSPRCAQVDGFSLSAFTRHAGSCTRRHRCRRSTVAVTTHPAQQDYPDIQGDWVVWQDWRHNPGTITPKFGAEFVNADVYAKNLVTGEELRVTHHPQNDLLPQIDRGRVFFLWASDIYMVELAKLRAATP